MYQFMLSKILPSSEQTWLNVEADGRDSSDYPMLMS